MISERQIKKYCCEDISLIENYYKAINDKTQVWDCHHRLEIHGKILLSANELKDLDLYYNRPAYELIFLTKQEHHELHANNRPIESKLKAIESNKHPRGKYKKKLNDITK